LTLPQRLGTIGFALAVLANLRADQRRDQEERDGNQEVQNSTSDEADSFVRPHRGPDVFHQRDGFAPAAPVELEEAPGSGRTMATQIGQNEFGAGGTFPDEAVPLGSRESAATEIARGRPTLAATIKACRGPCGRYDGFRRGTKNPAVPPADRRKPRRGPKPPSRYAGRSFLDQGSTVPKS
jgi:hypothetical protein